jgi:hypothetical protein
MFREASKEEPTSKKKNLLTSENKKKLKQKHKKSYFSFSPYCNRFKNSNLDSHKCLTKHFFLKLFTCVCCHKNLNIHLRLMIYLAVFALNSLN